MTYQDIIPILLICLCAGLSSFCFLLSRRLRRMNDLETGLGGAIAVMISEVNRLESAIRAARAEALKATDQLSSEVEKAKQERAYWMLQQQFTPPSTSAPKLRRRRTRTERSLEDAL